MKMGYPLTQAEKREICAWKYEGEYAVWYWEGQLVGFTNQIGRAHV